jgi:hypothetical protein
MALKRFLILRKPPSGPGAERDIPQGSLVTLRWREMDSNFWYRGRKAVDFRSIPGIAYRRSS